MRVTSIGVAYTVSVMLAAGCGSVADADADAAGDGGGGVDGGVDGGGGSPDAPLPLVRALHLATPSDGNTELYAADIVDGTVGPAAHLSTMADNPTATVTSVTTSTDGRTIIYRADAVTEGQPALYFLRYGNGGPSAPVKISGDHGGGNFVVSQLLTADGTKAIYGWGNISFAIATVSYYLVDLSGASPGSPVPLHTAVGTTLESPVLSDDGTRFAFDDFTKAYVVDLRAASPSAVQVSGTGVSGTGVNTVALSPNGDRVAYVSDAVTSGVDELWVVDLSGSAPGTPQKASAPLPAGHDVAHGFFAPVHVFSPDGTKLAYIEGDLSTYLYELHVVDVSGAAPGPARKVNGTMVAMGGVGDGSAGAILTTFFGFLPDSRYIFYQADQRTNDIFELFLVDVSGSVPGAPDRVSGDLVAGGSVSDYVVAPDGSGLAYVADQRVVDVNELFYVDLRGATPGVPQIANGNLTTGGNIYVYGLTATVAFSPDGDKLAYAADQIVDRRMDVFLTDVGSGVPLPPMQVQAATNAASTVPSLAFSHDSAMLVWTANAETTTYDLYASDVRGSQPTTPTKVNDVTRVGPTFWLTPTPTR